ncbi:DUF1624 domain-containing protein [Fibrella aquatilis]|uniref:DUF1624 domain-containing protein n=1 Tax=Fibrella aquatilis TaxID=2817059 RepID=A0A939G5A6_9BACT|nr:heparan-alpha-glucosaminide N-acetyltransferase domain-containing protein [Fibrella aquatilis]MBO0930690.1 DUF1624 domain-containing protein [Fibrella aquatilis]
MQTNNTETGRIVAIDVVRGLVMVIMALDHVRDLLHLPALTQNPTDLTTTTAPIFLTRWVTHLCAPTFVFLSGTSAFLSLRKRSLQDIKLTDNQFISSSSSAFLLRRGLVLILLELTLINFAFWTDIQFRSLMLQVIFVIGTGLILLSWLSKFPVRWLAVAGLVIVFGHDLLTSLSPFASAPARLAWSLLFRTDVFPFGTDFILLVAYPIIPWFGIMLLGYACGPFINQPVTVRKMRLLQAGAICLGVFLALRLLNLYGDPTPWTIQKSPLFTILSFLNVSKYPPSLLYTALMLGIMCGLLWLADGPDNRFTRLLRVYGNVPLFYYLIHWYLVKLAMILTILIQGYALHDMPLGPLNFGRPPAAGVSLPVVYVVWLLLVALLYPLCHWYGRYKANHPQLTWLRYI